MPTPILFREAAYFGARLQSAQGVSAGVPTRFFKLRQQAFAPSQGINNYRNGDTRDINGSVKEWFRYVGAMQTLMYADETAFALAMALGKDVVSGSSPTLHTITCLDNIPYFTSEVAFYEGQIVNRIVDTKYAKLMVECEAEKWALVTHNLLGCTPSVVTPSTVSFNDAAGEGPMMMHQSAVTLVGPADASVLQAQMQKFSIEIDQGLSPEHSSGFIQPIALFEQGRTINVKCTARFSGPNIWNLIHYGSSGGTAISSGIGSGSFEVKFTSQLSPERSIDITCPNINWTVGKPKYSPDMKTGLIELEATGVKVGATLPMNVLARNGVAAAYTN